MLCTEDRQCKVNLADEYHRNPGPTEVSGSLVTGFWRVKISLGILKFMVGGRKCCLLPVTVFFNRDVEYAS